MLTRFAFLVAFFLPAPLLACSVCAVGAGQRASIREQLALSKTVIRGDLKNPKFSSTDGGGTTEFHISNRVKPHAVVADLKMILLPKYFPVIGNTPTDYLLFFDIADNKPDLITGIPCSKELVAYVEQIDKLPEKDMTARLEFYFKHLDSSDTSVAEDAFLEFVKASDADLTAAKNTFDDKLLRTYLNNPKLPPDKIGVFALLLGLVGKETDAKFLQQLLVKSREDASATSVAGLLAGLTLLDSKAGWSALKDTLTDTKLNYAQRLAALTALRYLQANRMAEMKAEVHEAYKLMLACDFADLAIGDLRRFQWWMFTDEVVRLYEKPNQSRMVRKMVVRYALCSPEPSAKKFIEALRKTDPQTVQDAEKFLRDTEEIKPMK